MASLPGPGSSRASLRLVLAMMGMLVLPAIVTLRTVRLMPVQAVADANPSPYGYTVSLLLFLVPIAGIGFWMVPAEGIRISKRSFAWTIGILFPVGAALDFFFARIFLTFENTKATLGIRAPALGGSVPLEEYVFYLTGFVTVLLTYIWLDEYWLAAYTVPVDAGQRLDFSRLLRFHPASLLLAAGLVGAGIVYKRIYVGEAGFPGYFTFQVVGALLPAAVLLPEALPVINWRALSLTFFMIVLTSLLWEATLAAPYRWWGYQEREMLGLKVTAWYGLPVEAVVVWVAVTYQTVIVYEIVKRWQASGRSARSAFFG